MVCVTYWVVEVQVYDYDEADLSLNFADDPGYKRMTVQIWHLRVWLVAATFQWRFRN